MELSWWQKALLWLAGQWITPALLESLLNELFTALKIGVGQTESKLDDALLERVEQSVDKKRLAVWLAAWLDAKLKP